MNRQYSKEDIYEANKQHINKQTNKKAIVGPKQWFDDSLIKDAIKKEIPKECCNWD